MPDDKDEADYGTSTQEEDFRQRMLEEKGEADTEVAAGRDWTGGRDEEDLDSFVGVSPEYRNAANSVDLPQSAPEDTPLGYFEDKHIDASDGIIVGAENRVSTAGSVLYADEESDEDKSDVEKNAAAGKATGAPVTEPKESVTGAAGAGGTKAAAADSNQAAAKGKNS